MCFLALMLQFHIVSNPNFSILPRDFLTIYHITQNIIAIEDLPFFPEESYMQRNWKLTPNTEGRFNP